MATSDNSRIRTASKDRGPSVDGLPSPSRYDLLLAAIPLAFLTTLLASQVLGASVRLAVTAASLVGAAVLADGLFRNPPRRPGRVDDG